MRFVPFRYRWYPWLLIGILAFTAIGYADEKDPKAKAEENWQSLFNGRDLSGWKVTPFGGQGDVYVEDGQILMEFGASLTGITYQKPLPRDDYEIRLEAKRLDGTDFFCGLTFPVQDKYLTLIVGGWGGALVGLSSIDGDDASENDTQLNMAFKRDQWYRIRVRVHDDAVAVWIDEKRVIQRSIKHHELSIRPEVNLSRPFGLCAWQTRAAMRNLALRRLSIAGD